MDPVQALQEAFTLPADSPAQLLKLQSIRTSLEAAPGPLTPLLPPLLGGIVPNPDSAFKRWIIEMLGFALGHSTLGIDAKAQLAMGCLDSMARLLMDPSWTIRKGVMVAWCCAYGHIFRHLCSTRNAAGQWEVVQRCKRMILGLMENSNSTPGQMVAGLKFAQRVVLVQSRGANDPRVIQLQNKADPNLNMCPPDHPYMNARELEAEAAGLMQQMLNMLYQSQIPEVLSAVMNLTIPFVKLRTDLVQPVLQALTNWTPAHISTLPASEIKSVEKALRIVLMHIMRHGYGNLQLRGDVNEALLSQMTRMDVAAREEHARRQDRKRTLPEGSSDAQGNGKKAKMEPAKLTDFNFRELPHAIVTELVVANLLAVTQGRLDAVVAAYRQASAGATNFPETASSSKPAEVVVKDEPIDPLNMELEEELEYEPEKLNSNLEVDDAEAGADETVVALPHIDFELPPAKRLSPEERIQVVKSTIDRIRLGGEPYLETSSPVDAEKEKPVKGLPPGEAWVLFLVRLATRGPPASNVRQILCEYVTLDFQSRHRLATIWMNEEWYNDTVRRELDPSWIPQYDVWIQKLLSAPDIKLDAKDKAYTRFIIDLPAFPPNLLSLLRDRCIDSETMPVGFNTLRELVTLRPPIRTQAMMVLLDLTTHSDKVIRGAAIITVRRWVPDQQPMDNLVRMFASGMLRRLATKEKPPPIDSEMTDADAEGSDKASSSVKEENLTEERSLSSYLPDELELPAEKSVVLQHIELLLGLAVKVPEFLNQIFDSYGQMDESVQESLQTLLVPLIKTLGPTNPKLLELLQSFPPQAESLALRTLTILTDHARPTPQIVNIVKDLVSERELDSKFLIIIIGEMDKSDIVKHLPRIVTMLTGKVEDRDQIRKVFSNIVTEGPTGASSNMPRVRHSERLAPAELLVLLHEQEKEIGLKGAMAAIDICFSMADIFRSETLAVVMQQIVDAPTLPVLFMRTVIRAVQTYKGLISFVSTTLFSRLIVKKIWTNSQLWEGFIKCAKITAPSSFGALLQLQREQLREVVDKQPSLRNGLREYVIKKERNKPKLQSFLETLGDGDVTMEPPPMSDTPPPPLASLPTAVSPNA